MSGNRMPTILRSESNYLVTLWSDVDNCTVDQGSTLLKGFSDHAQDDVEPEKMMSFINTEKNLVLSKTTIVKIY